MRIEIREEGCRGCQMCVDICPTEVLEYDSIASKARVRKIEDCISCLSCKYLCPSGSLSCSDYHVVKNFYRDATFTRRMGRYL